MNSLHGFFQRIVATWKSGWPGKVGLVCGALAVVMVCSIGCVALILLIPTPEEISGSPINPTSEPRITRPPTSTPQSSATPVPPTPTPMPVTAQAAATFAGSMTVSSRGQNASASRGEIEFVTSADGTAIVSLSYTLHDQECSYVSGSSSTTITSGSSESTLHPAEPIPITNGQFVLDFMGVRATGNLNSPSEASGQITIEKEESISSPSLQRFTCDYGTWNWNANVQ